MSSGRLWGAVTAWRCGHPHAQWSGYHCAHLLASHEGRCSVPAAASLGPSEPCRPRAGPKGLPPDSDNYSARPSSPRRNQSGPQMKSPIHSFESAGAGMIFVEGFRLLFVLAGSVAGFEIGRNGQRQPARTGRRPAARCRRQLCPRRRRRPTGRQGPPAGGVPLPQHPSRGDLRRLDHLDHRDAAGPGDRASPAGALPIRLRAADHRLHRLGPGHPRLEARLGQGRQIVAAAGLSRILAPPPDPTQGPRPAGGRLRHDGPVPAGLGPRRAAPRRHGHPPVRARPRPVGGHQHPTR